MSNSSDLNARSDSSARPTNRASKINLSAQLKSASQQLLKELERGFERGWDIIRVRETHHKAAEAAPLRTNSTPLTSADLRDTRIGAQALQSAVVDRQILKLQDGRRVSFRTLGTANAQEWILFHHGYPGSSCQAKLMHELAREHGWGVLAIDRPGFAQSDFDAGRSLKTTAYDAIEVATKLGIASFHVVGVSGGAPYALATAAAAPQRTRSLSTVGGLAQLAAPDLEAKLSAFEKFCVRRARSGGVTAHLLFGWMERGVRQDEEAVIKRWIDRLAPADRAEMEKPELREVLVNSLKEAIEPGIRGVIADLRLLASPWDFSLEHVHSPAWIWHGTEDNVVPYAHGVYLATGLRQARLMTVEGAGHYSLCLTERQKIVEQILSFAEQSDVRPAAKRSLSPELT